MNVLTMYERSENPPCFPATSSHGIRDRICNPHTPHQTRLLGPGSWVGSGALTLLQASSFKLSLSLSLHFSHFSLLTSLPLSPLTLDSILHSIGLDSIDWRNCRDIYHSVTNTSTYLSKPFISSQVLLWLQLFDQVAVGQPNLSFSDYNLLYNLNTTAS